MKHVYSLAVVIAAVLYAAPMPAHDVPNMEHSHAFQQTGYGKYRQGHYVNGPNGSIIIWSARPYTGYQARSPVKMARPQPITEPPGGSSSLMRAEGLNPAINYGKTLNSGNSR